MKRAVVSNTLLLMSFVFGASILSSLAHAEDAMWSDRDDRLACYKWSRFPNERLKLDIKKDSRLSEPKEEERFRHAKQTAFSVHGKEIGICGGNTMAATTGTVVTAVRRENTTGDTGAHMSLISLSVRGNTGDSCRPVELDCTTEEESPVPRTWQCFSRNEFNVFHGASTLTLVDEDNDPRCSLFQDGQQRDASDSVDGTGSGLNSN